MPYVRKHRGMGLGPDDSCYDRNHPWWLPNIFNDSAECDCIAAQNRPIGEQCASIRGVAQTMGGQVGNILGNILGGAATGTVQGTAQGVVDTGGNPVMSLFGTSIDWSTIAIYGVGAFLLYTLITSRPRRRR